jgi:hypothetical protein
MFRPNKLVHRRMSYGNEDTDTFQKSRWLSGSATVGTMLLVSASAKIGYGVWALGIAAMACVLYRAGKHIVG